MGVNKVRAGARKVRRTAIRRGLAVGVVVLALAGAPLHADEVYTHWSMPVITTPEAERPAGPNVFGTIALPVRARPTSTRWSKIMQASLEQPALDRLIQEAQAFSPQEQVAFVQQIFSRTVRPVATTNNCSDDGYWAPAQETLARGKGDCFDLAVGKMEALRRLGVPGKDLYLTTGWFGRGDRAGRGAESAALLVRLGDRFWLLPEQEEATSVAASDLPVVADPASAGGPAAPVDAAPVAIPVPAVAYTPVVTYGVGMTWVHGRVVQMATLAANPVTNPSR